MIGVELEVLSKKQDRFGWERDRGSAAHDRLMVDWMDALQDFPIDEIRAACRAVVEANPDRMPNEGHIKAKILEARCRHVELRPRLDVQPAAPRNELSAAQRQQVAASLGLKTFGFDTRGQG